MNCISAELSQYETPFANVSFVKEEMEDEDFENYNMQLCQQLESPFAQTFEMPSASMNQSPLAQEYVGLLGELHDSEFFFKQQLLDLI